MSESRSKRGRPRSEAARLAILEATFHMLQERGYEGLAIEALAEAAGSSKSTVHRWWATRAELAVEAFFTFTRAELAFPNTGSARGDFRSQILKLARLLRGPGGRVLVTMLAGARNDPALALALGEGWLKPRRLWGLKRMQRAIEEGECRAGIDVDAALGVLYGPLYTPLLFGQTVPRAHEVEAHLDIAFAGIFVADPTQA